MTNFEDLLLLYFLRFLSCLKPDIPMGRVEWLMKSPIIIVLFLMLLGGLYHNFNPNHTSFDNARNYQRSSQRQVLSLAQENLEHIIEGSLRDDGDSSWNENEYDIYKFNLKEFEALRVELTVNRNVSGVFLLLFDGDSYRDIEDIMVEYVFNGMSNRIYDIDVVKGNAASIFYRSEVGISLSLAVFTYSSIPIPQLEYTIKSSLPPKKETQNNYLAIGVILSAMILSFVFIVLYWYRQGILQKRVKCLNCNAKVSKTKYKFCIKCGYSS